MENIILVGTAHVSPSSIRKVRETIEREKPEIVAVELCEKRYRALLGELQPAPLREILKGGNVYFMLAQWLLAYVQRKIGEQAGVEPGAELLEAIRSAEKVGAKVALIDRDLQVTLQRFWTRMKLREKLKLIFAIFGALIGREKVEVERITERDVVTELVMELRNFSPSAAEVLLDERDAYIAGRLIELSKKEKGKIVAVVGAGHLEGVQKFLSSPERIPPLTTLTKIEKKRVTFSRVFGIFLILLLLSFFGLLLSSIPFHSFVLAFSCWVVVTGSLAALGAALAGGHPFSVLTAFSLAWFGVLHPLLATGWFSGIVEAWVRTPTQKDFKELSRAQSFRDLYGNRLFRILLVAALTNLGAMMGGWIIGPWAVVRVTDVDIIGTIRGLFP